jgi:hypothetical protein
MRGGSEINRFNSWPYDQSPISSPDLMSLDITTRTENEQQADMSRIQDDPTVRSWRIRPRADERDPVGAQTGGRQGAWRCWLLTSLTSRACVGCNVDSGEKAIGAGWLMVGMTGRGG